MEWKHRGFEKEVSSGMQMPWELIFESYLGVMQYVQVSVFSNFLLVASVYYLSSVLFVAAELLATLDA